MHTASRQVAVDAMLCPHLVNFRRVLQTAEATLNGPVWTKDADRSHALRQVHDLVNPIFDVDDKRAKKWMSSEPLQSFAELVTSIACQA